MNKVKVVAVVPIIFSVFLFYLAATLDFEHVSKYEDVIDLRNVSYRYPFDFGEAWYSPVKPYLIIMQPNDYLTVSTHAFPINGTVYLVLWDEHSHTVIKYSPTLYASSAFLDFKTPDKIHVEVYVASENPNNVVPVTVTLHHYVRPHWPLFSAAIIILILGIVLLTVPRLPTILRPRYTWHS
ncbi:MAG: hypothetical protein QXN95_01690 [Candidatus Bathyarchaeia archaeon]